MKTTRSLFNKVIISFSLDHKKKTLLIKSALQNEKQQEKKVQVKF
jgi:hypothetical protein